MEGFHLLDSNGFYMKYISFIIILLLLSLSSFSQGKVPGYIVINNGDTLSGIIRRTGGFNDKPGFTFFDKQGTHQKVMDKDLKAFGWLIDTVQEDYIKVKALGIGSGGYAFLKKIIVGKISLFTQLYGSADNLYIYTEDNKEYGVTDAILGINKKILKKLMASCPSVIEKITGLIRKKQLIELIKEYNTCN